MSSYPTPILTTSRLTLRPMTMEDAADLFAVFSDPAVVRYWSAPTWTSIAFAEQNIERALESYREQSEVRFGIELAETGQLIGTANLHHFFPQNRRCEIGYALGSAYWGKGFASEALEAAIDYAFHELRLNRIEADIDPRNAASAGVLERMGFRKEGYMPERWFVHGEMADTINYGLLRSYWDERGRR
ncbi:GNAT family N-acetyltransferase [Massilia sp. IC2-477]|uniref:GNAT family N-acetyltransferase n=1 Tax=Massilia sp. IC2-477 TaxID=2887198 RepID=UPI001D12FE50|nr:GNAT family N-acetyltransferase [Massilia sp. IC2-477]MCC2954203.1 GNAT family N-acetyltransferase [Massilia sp. IC2-477]